MTDIVKRLIHENANLGDEITGDLDLLGDWLAAKGYTEELAFARRAMDEINKLRAENEKMREMWDETLLRAIPVAAVLKETGDE